MSYSLYCIHQQNSWSRVLGNYKKRKHVLIHEQTEYYHIFVPYYIILPYSAGAAHTDYSETLCIHYVYTIHVDSYNSWI